MPFSLPLRIVFVNEQTPNFTKMAMLADRRVKRKYNHFSAKANANWAQESNSVGLKLLKSMGWAEGKGLGVDESGTATPIAIAYKNDNLGLGCRNLEGDMAVAQQKEFDALLANLSERDREQDATEKPSEQETPKSLELMSQKSRARVHYHKFTRGKDLSRASSKDLASILGIAEKNPVEEKLKKVVPAVGPALQHKHLTSSGSMVDYFNKLKNKKNLPESTNKLYHEEVKSSEDAVINREEGSPCNISILDSNEEGSSSKQRRRSVTWSPHVKVSFVSKYIKDMADTSTESVDEESSDAFQGTEIVEESLKNGDKKKKKKNKRKCPDSLDNTWDSLDDTTSTEIVNMCSEDQPPIKKSKEKSQEAPGDPLDESTSSDIDSILQTDDLAVEDNSIQKRNIKKSQKSCGEPLHESISTNVDSVMETVDLCSEDQPKQKKNKKKRRELSCKSFDESPCTNFASVMETVDYCSDDQPKQKKNKKKRRESSCESFGELISTNVDSVVDTVDLSVEDQPKQKKNKKKSRKSCSESFNESTSTNAAFDKETVDLGPEDQPEQKKNKKRNQESSSKSFGELTSTNFDSVVETVDLCAEEEPNKKKSKKKSTKSSGESLNESTPINIDSIVETVDLCIEDQSKQKRKKKKTQESSGEVNGQLNFTDGGSCLEIIEMCSEDQSEKKKNKKRKKSKSGFQIEGNGFEGTVSKEPQEPNIVKSTVEADTSQVECVSQPTLSALTRERMEKWKKRKHTKDIKNVEAEVNASLENSCCNTSPVELGDKKDLPLKGEIVKSSPSKEKVSTMSSYNPKISAVVNYNHKRVLKALGFDVKKTENKQISIEIPPTNIPGSNLDFIRGYGEGLPCL